MAHRNARLTVHARRLLVDRFAAGWPAARIAEQLGISGPRSTSGSTATTPKATPAWLIAPPVDTAARPALRPRWRTGFWRCAGPATAGRCSWPDSSAWWPPRSGASCVATTSRRWR
jgi:hypothetical protein